MRLCLLSGISGLGKRFICDQKLAPFLRSPPEKLAHAPHLSVGTGDVEKELEKLFPDEEARVRIVQQDRLAVLIGQLPPDQIRARWGEAYQKAVEEATKDNPDIAIVRACLEYYRFTTFEYFCPLDMDVLKQAEYRPNGILTLIDDIYDVYYRLSQEREVFAIDQLVGAKLQSLEPPIAADDLRALYREAINVVVECLHRVLVWREKELAAAVNIARTLGATHSVLATKHPVETGARLLLGGQAKELGYESSYPVYVSHPISRPRRTRQQKGAWPDFVAELNSFICGLQAGVVAGVAVVPVMPTGIDEFRLLEDSAYVRPALTPRWPFPLDDVMFCLPKKAPVGEREFADYDDYERRGLNRIFDPPIDRTGKRVGPPSLPDAEVSGILRALKEALRLQMAGRDHFLVRQCPGLFLYRPVYAKGVFSDGVIAEVLTFGNTRKYEQRIGIEAWRRVAFIHDVADADEFFRLGGPASKEYGGSAVYTVVRTLESKAEDLLREARLGTKAQVADPKHVAAALREYGDPRAKIGPIHEDLFPDEGSSPINQPVPLAQESTTQPLTEAVVAARARVLTHNLEGVVCYVYSEGVLVYRFPPGAAISAENYVEVIRGLAKYEGRATKAADRVRNFLASGTPGTRETSES